MKLFCRKPDHVVWALLAFFLTAPISLIAQSGGTGRLESTVFVVDSEGRSFVPGAKIVLSGPSTLEAESDQEGKCVFTNVAPGTYSIQVQFPGLEAAETVAVEAGKTTQSSLQLQPAAVKSSITVTATEPEVKAPTTDQTITEKTVRDAPNQNDRVENVLPLVPGVVRGPDGRINMKGARNTQSGALVNSANVTDPATGSPGLDLPIDVVESVQVISNPYDPQYGKLTGAVSSIGTKTSAFDKFHFSIQNVMPRARVRNGTMLGVGGATPRVTFTGPIIKDRLAFTQSTEYRFIRTPVNSLPPYERDTTLEAVNSYTQFDLNLTPKQTATVSFSLSPQKLQYLGLNTFTPQPSTSDYHQRGYQVYAQHRYVTGEQSLLTSQFSYKTFDTDLTPASDGVYRLLPETTEGGFFNLQARRSSRVDWQETYQLAPRNFLGTHQFRVGLNYAHSTYDGRQAFQPVEIADVSGTAIERITFSEPSSSSIGQNEIAWFASDKWTPLSRLTLDLGLRFDRDSVTDSVHAAPRVGFQLALTSDGKTLLHGGGGLFYDRVPLMIPTFSSFPSRNVSVLDPLGQIESSTSYSNKIEGELRNPRSVAWNLAVSRQVLQGLTVQVGYEWRKTTDDFVVSPQTCVGSCILSLSNRGEQSYRELQVSGRYYFRKHVLNASYVHSRAYGDLNDFFQFFGNTPKPVIQPNDRGRLSYDAPNRVLLWGEFKAPWKVTVLPVYDIHTGFPYSVQNVFRDYIGPRNSERFPRFQSVDLQVLRPIAIPIGDRHLKARVGFSVFNLFNHDNPRDVQTVSESSRFGQFYNNAWREYRGKFVIEF
ncbi:MAG: TonB-dependent receptor [Acidobacteriia bacterium]|nr:TonB-dependent receptor [Terriglobia bacterium]